MTFAIRIFERLRLFQPLGLLFEPGASHMPRDSTADMPSCLLCNKRSKLPPSQMGWLQAGDEIRLFLICGDCGFDCEDTELEGKIIERVSRPVLVE